MIKSTDLINEINKTLKKYYPIEKTFDDICYLSHFWLSLTEFSFLPFHFDIDGSITSGIYKSYKIIKVNTMTWKQYLLLYMSFTNLQLNPFVDQNNTVIKYMQRKNKVDILYINDLTIQKNNKIIKIDAEYISTSGDWSNTYLTYPPKINKDNHFYLSSFWVDKNKDELRTELMRLFINRDKYKSMHFHLDHNGGGDNIPGHLIVRCLVGKKEKWMKNIQKIDIGNKITNWDCWNEDKEGVYNYKRVQILELGDIPKYETRYTGKIHLHMSSQNGSAAWYFITYMIYAFGSNIKRYSKKYYGQNLKFGTIDKDSQLVLHGHSATCSGDGNPLTVNKLITVPTHQFLDNTIKKKDWNRFWYASK